MKIWLVRLSLLGLIWGLAGCNCGGDTGIRQFECDDHSECKTNQACKDGKCVLDDEDGDGFPSRTDCNDKDPRIYPGRNEVCDNKVDDNCNDKIDEIPCRCEDGQTRECGSDKGTCSKGTQQCKNGLWALCEGDIAPQREECNGIDDDCDGKVDEDFGTLGEACKVGKGECAASGKFVCAKDRKAAACDAQPGEPGKELCDEKDNDCDGLIDEVRECQKQFIRAAGFSTVAQQAKSSKFSFFGILGQTTALHSTKPASDSNGRTLRGGFLPQTTMVAP